MKVPFVGKKRIMIVEDEPSLQKALRDKLEREGYNVTSVRLGSKVIGEVQICKPDIILLDLMLPGQDGISLLETLRGQDIKYEKPIIVITNLTGSTGIRADAEKLGAQFLNKADAKIETIVDLVKQST